MRVRCEACREVMRAAGRYCAPCLELAEDLLLERLVLRLKGKELVIEVLRRAVQAEMHLDEVLLEQARVLP